MLDMDNLWHDLRDLKLVCDNYPDDVSDRELLAMVHELAERYPKDLLDILP